MVLTDSDTLTPRSTYFIFVLLFLLYMFDYIDRLVVVSLFPYIKKDWGVTDAQLGFLISAVYWSILIFTLPFSILVDRWSRKKSIGLMSVIWGLGTIACAFTRNFSQLFMARSVIGLGEAAYAPGGSALISGKSARADAGHLERGHPFGECYRCGPGGIYRPTLRVAACLRTGGFAGDFDRCYLFWCAGLQDRGIGQDFRSTG